MQTSIDLLKKVYLFENLSNDELTWIAENVSVKEVIAGDSVFNEGSKAESMFIVKQGSIEVRKKGSHEEQQVAMVSKGSIVGEMAFAHPGPRTASLIAKENCALLEMNYEKLKMKCEATPAFGMKLYRSLSAHLSKRIQQTTHDLASLKELKLRAQ